MRFDIAERRAPRLRRVRQQQRPELGIEPGIARGSASRRRAWCRPRNGRSPDPTAQRRSARGSRVGFPALIRLQARQPVEDGSEVGVVLGRFPGEPFRRVVIAIETADEAGGCALIEHRPSSSAPAAQRPRDRDRRAPCPPPSATPAPPRPHFRSPCRRDTGPRPSGHPDRSTSPSAAPAVPRRGRGDRCCGCAPPRRCDRPRWPPASASAMRSAASRWPQATSAMTARALS